MESQRLQEALEHADLTTYQAQAYVTLIEHGRLPATEVAKKSSIPSSQIYNTLQELDDVGFVELIERENLHAQARDPEEVLSHLRSRGELLTEAAAELEDRWEQPPLMEHRVNVVKYAETVVDRVRQRLQDASVAVKLALSVGQLETLAPELIATAESGVVVHLAVYDQPDLTDRLAELGVLDSPVRVRRAHIPGPFVAILDRRETYFAPYDRADEDYGVLIRDEILSFIVHWYFQTCLWVVSPWVDGTATEQPTYLGLEQFIRDVAPLIFGGVTVQISVEGKQIDTGDQLSLSGTVVDLSYPDAATNHSPTIEDLSTLSVIAVDTGERVVSVGGWGAVYEDVEAHRISVESIAFGNSVTGA